MKTFKNYYKFPLKPMEGLESLKVLTDDNQMAFDWCVKLSSSTRDNILKKINNLSAQVHIRTVYKNGYIYFKNHLLLRIRGWGHLTGIGGLHLSEEEAIKIQDEFGNYIVKQLNR